jgi:phenylalanyl-tRNA synthetase beta chain
VNALGGTRIPEARMREILEALGFTFSGNMVNVPTWRHDVSQPADLTEEVLRIVGYDSIPTAPLPKSLSVSLPAISPTQLRAALTRRALAARGLNEHYGWGFCSEAQAAAFGGQSEALRLLNPISAELSVMRPNLLPHLIDAAIANQARGMADVALFELGAVFHDVTPTGQKTIAAGIRAGLRHGLHYSGAPKVDLFDVKADALAALAAAGFDASKAPVTRSALAWYHPGRSGAIALGKNVIAVFGELHPATLKTLGCDFPLMAFEVYLDNIPQARAAKRKALSVSDYQPVVRDFAFVVDATTPAADLVSAINKAEKTLLQNVAIFDVYQGKGVDPDKKSIALSVTLQAPDRTLTDAEIDTVSKAIIASAAKAGAVLR